MMNLITLLGRHYPEQSPKTWKKKFPITGTEIIITFSPEATMVGCGEKNFQLLKPQILPKMYSEEANT